MSHHIKTCQLYGADWVWVPPDIERGHWLATDNSGIAIFAPSDGINDIQLYIPVHGTGSREMVLHFAPELLEQAFLYAARARRARGN